MSNNITSRKLGLLGSLLLGASTLSTSQIAFAQTGSVFDEVIVTAQKREQNSQDVGIAITTFTGEQLQELGFQDSTDIALLSAGVNISQSNGGLQTSFSIRGVTQNDFNDQSEAPNAVYIDEGYVSFGAAQQFSIFDLDRVEVLKGPQGTLFGRNATGGLAHFITKKPTQETDGYAEVTFASFDTVRAEAALGGGLTEDLSGRLSLHYSNRGSYFDNRFPENAVTGAGPGVPPSFGGEDDGESESIGVRGQLLWEPSDDFSALFSGSYGRANLSTPTYFNRPSVVVEDAAGNQINSIPGGPGSTNAFGDPGCSPQDVEDLSCSRDFALNGINHNQQIYGTLKLTKELGNSLTLTSITDYRDFDKAILTDVDGGAATTLNFVQDTEVAQFSQEIRLSGDTDEFRWVTGLYYLNIDNFTIGGVDNPADGVPFLPTGPGTALLTESDTQTDSFSVFGQGEYDITDDVTFILGARVIRELKDFTGSESLFASPELLEVDVNPALFLAPIRAAEEFEQNNTLWSGKAQIEYTPTSNVLLYAGVNRGVKAGNFNSPFTFGGPLPAPIPFDEEILLSYEGGIKSQWLDGRLRFNAAVYHYDYKDYQVFLFDDGASSITNADATFTGVDADILWSPIDNLEIVLTGAYIDATVEDFQIDTSFVQDVRPTFTPEFQTSGVVKYTWNDLFHGDVSVQGDYAYQTATFTNARNFDTTRIDDNILLNARLSWSSPDDGFEAALWVKNLSDERTIADYNDLSGLVGGDSFTVIDPRTIGGTLRANF